jgi:hypothetical protein
MAQQPKDEALIFMQCSYPDGIAIPASLASQVLERLEIWRREYKDGGYVMAPQSRVQEMFLIPVRDVIASRMLAAMQPKEEV